MRRFCFFIFLLLGLVRCQPSIVSAPRTPTENSREINPIVSVEQGPSANDPWAVVGTSDLGSGYLYQWEQSLDGGVIYEIVPDAINPQWNLDVTQVVSTSPISDLKVRVVVTPESGGAPTTSSPTSLALPLAIGVLEQPSAQTGEAGGIVTFAVNATIASGTLSYQWQQSSDAGFENIEGATNASLILSGFSENQNGRLYRVMIRASGGATSVLSSAAPLTVVPPVNNTEICSDGIDNDNDGTIDCADPDCNGVISAGGSVCEYLVEVNCTDSFDNDGDGLTDLSDTMDCSSCTDSDSDSYGDGCAAGTDCDGTNASLTTDCSSNLKVHLELNGSNGSTTITDATGNYTFTANGSTQISTAQSKFGGASAQISAQNSYGSGQGGGAHLIKSNETISLAGDFTVEFWFHQTNGVSEGGSPAPLEIGSLHFVLHDNSRNTFLGDWTNGYVTQGYHSASFPELNTWHHIAVTRSSGTIRVFVNGQEVETATYTQTISGLIKLGAYDFEGFIDNFKIIVGYAAYLTSFTPPTCADEADPDCGGISSSCGNGVCDAGEDASTCPSDNCPNNSCASDGWCVAESTFYIGGISCPTLTSGGTGYCSGTGYYYLSEAQTTLNSSGTGTWNSQTYTSGSLKSVITINTQPSNQTASSGSASFSVSATVTNSATLSYQWQKQEGGTGDFSNVSNGSGVSGANTATLSLSSLVSGTDNGDVYRVKVSATGGADDVISSSATLTVAAQGGGAPSSGSLFAWGDNGDGQLGDGTTTSRSSPLQIGTDTWSSVASGTLHSVAIRSDGKLFSWGYNYHGALGDGTTNTRTTPFQIGTATWSSVAAGYGHTVAIRSDGKLFAWGLNYNGQLGDGTTDDQGYPKQIGTDTWTAVATGDNHTVAIRSDGKLFTWGLNHNGQLGDGTTSDQTAPLQIGTDTWTAVTAGESFTVAIRSDGKLFSWGSGFYGQLGDGTSTARQMTPLQIGTDTWTAVDAGNVHTLAIRSDGKLFAWGGNGNGQIGNGTTNIRQSTLVQIGTDTWSVVAAGGFHSIAIRSDGKLFTWGSNAIGQLGDGTTTDQTSPIQIGADTWTAAAGGYNHTLALRSVSCVSTVEVCDGVDNDCDGITDENTDVNGCECGETTDACGVCGGNDSSCTDCAGVPNGTSILDACGVCGGDGSSCSGGTDCTDSTETWCVMRTEEYQTVYYESRAGADPCIELCGQPTQGGYCSCYNECPPGLIGGCAWAVSSGECSSPGCWGYVGDCYNASGTLLESDVTADHCPDGTSNFQFTSGSRKIAGIESEQACNDMASANGPYFSWGAGTITGGSCGGSASSTPVITINTQPSNQTASGGSASFSVSASVTQSASLSYQWQRQEGGSGDFSNISNGSGVSGATTATLSLSSLTYANDNGDAYRVVVSATGGATIVNSSGATLTVNQCAANGWCADESMYYMGGVSYPGLNSSGTGYSGSTYYISGVAHPGLNSSGTGTSSTNNKYYVSGALANGVYNNQCYENGQQDMNFSNVGGHYCAGDSTYYINGSAFPGLNSAGTGYSVSSAAYFIAGEACDGLNSSGTGYCWWPSPLAGYYIGGVLYPTLNSSGTGYSSGDGIYYLSGSATTLDSSGTGTWNSQTYTSGSLKSVITINTQPTNQTASGGSASFSVSATVTNSATLSYQWQKQEGGSGGFSNVSDGSGVSGATTATLSLSSLTNGADNGDVYRVKVSATGNADNVDSSSATLTVAAAVGGDGPAACAGDCYLEGSGPDYAQSLTVGTERLGPSSSTLTLQYANGTDGFKLWKEKNGNRILNASGFASNGWQQILTRAGTAFDGTLTSSSVIETIAGRACPPNVFLDYDNMTVSQRCVYYDVGGSQQTLNAADPANGGPSGAILSEDWIANWDALGTGRGISSSYYEGNIKTCADKGMRLPTAYETQIPEGTATAFTMGGPGEYLPTGDGITPVWAESVGVPVSAFSWTATAHNSGTESFWVATADPNGTNWNWSAVARCILPSHGLGTTPVITINTQPSNQTASSGSASFSVSASVTQSANLSYQWQRQEGGSGDFSNISNGSGVSGATTATLSLSSLTYANDNGDAYRVVVSATGGATSVNSSGAMLTVSDNSGGSEGGSGFNPSCSSYVNWPSYTYVSFNLAKYNQDMGREPCVCGNNISHTPNFVGDSFLYQMSATYCYFDSETGDTGGMDIAIVASCTTQGYSYDVSVSTVNIPNSYGSCNVNYTAYGLVPASGSSFPDASGNINMTLSNQYLTVTAQ